MLSGLLEEKTNVLLNQCALCFLLLEGERKCDN